MSAPRTDLRVANLDLLRAAAILLVIPVNLVAAGVVELGPTATRVFESGWVGVDLFFVLSGWLVGGLYWREWLRFGNVELGRFWARRWLRTLPPYFVALLGVSVANAVLGGAAFDWRYLLFAQNYTGLPYWAVSWSLCVEEHFYLGLPLVLGLARRVRGGIALALGAAALLPLVARVLTLPEGASMWGLGYTATHMRLEGLALGVAASYVYHIRPELWPAVCRAGRWLALPGLLFVATVPWLPLDVLTRYAYTGVAVAFTALLVALVERRPLPLASSAVIRAVALTSYSVYMTHTVVLEAYRRVGMGMWPELPAGIHVAVSLVLVGAAGAVFYAVAERPSLWLRRRLAPRRPGARSPELVGAA